MMTARLAAGGLVLLWLAGCASNGGGHRGNAGLPPGTDIDLSSIPPAVPHAEPLSEYGNPRNYSVFGETYYTMGEAKAEDFVQTGKASWYGRQFHGQRTSSGETYNMFRMTAAHKTLPLPSYVRVTNLRNGRQVIVRVNDRGPFHGNRIIDLSYVAALKLDIVDTGTAPVRIETVTAEDVDPVANDDDAPRANAVTARTTAKPTVQKTAATGVTTLYLQVGAFAQRSNARQIAARLHRLGIGKVSTTAGPGNGTILYRVHVGPFASRARRQAVRRRLSLQGIPVIPVHQPAVR